MSIHVAIERMRKSFGPGLEAVVASRAAPLASLLEGIATTGGRAPELHVRFARMSQTCKCAAIGSGVQTFRIRGISAHFERVADLKPDLASYLDSRSVWACRSCGQFFACIQVPFKDAEEFLIPMPSPDWQAWNWPALPEIAEKCRWRGPQLDARFVL